MVNIDFDKFKKVTGYNIKSFFERFESFMSNQYRYVINYYNGGELKQDSFFELGNLLKDIAIIEPLFRINTNGLDTIDMWELLDLFSEVQTKLYTINKAGKWLKSSRLNTNDIGVKIERIQKQNETLEVMADDLGYNEPQDDWFDIALGNQIIEEDYTMDGGVIFTVILQNNFNIGLENIIDYTVGQNVLGKDIYRKITFENNDLKVVNYDKALEQSFEIKISMQKNSIPEFPDYGLDGQIIGTNVAAISYPALFRDLLDLFKQDGRWSEVNLLDIYRKDDAVNLKFEAKSILKESLVTNIKI